MTGTAGPEDTPGVTVHVRPLGNQSQVVAMGDNWRQLPKEPNSMCR
jgi:hypothetical protein